MIQRYVSKISSSSEDSTAVRGRVIAAREKQTERFKGGEENLQQRADGAEDDSHALHDIGGGRKAVGECGDAIGTVGAGTRPDFEGGADDCGPGWGGGYFAETLERGDSI